MIAYYIRLFDFTIFILGNIKIRSPSKMVIFSKNAKGSAC